MVNAKNKKQSLYQATSNSSPTHDENHKKVLLTWHGCAHYHIDYENIKIVVDPLYTRPPGDIPHLNISKDAADRIDYLLLTHAHVDHSWDFPYLVSKHHPEAYGPKNYLEYIKKKEGRWGLSLDRSRLHELETENGKTFYIKGIEVTPFQIGTEWIDFWFIRTTILRPFRHWSFSAMPAAHKFLLYHLRDNCFSYHFRFSSSDTTMLYFGNLTDQVDELSTINQVNVLAIPYCPANKKWLSHTQFLIERFTPRYVLVHHYDNFWHPYTHTTYRNLKDYKNAVLNKVPGANIVFSKFLEPINALTLNQEHN